MVRAYRKILEIPSLEISDVSKDSKKSIKEKTEDVPKTQIRTNNDFNAENWLTSPEINHVLNTEENASREVRKSAIELSDTLRSFHGPSVLRDGMKDFAQDFSSAVRGIPEIPQILAKSAGEFPTAFFKQIAEIPSYLARNLEELSPKATHERRELAREMEIRAGKTRDGILAEIQKEKDALYRQDLSLENREKLAELDNEIQAAEYNYTNEVARAKEIAPGTIESGLKHLAWSSLDAISRTLGMGRSVKKAGEALASSARDERERLRALEKENSEKEHVGVIERLGEFIVAKASELENKRKNFIEAIQEKITRTEQKNLSLYQDVLLRRIEALTKKTQSITQEDKEKISSLRKELDDARKGYLSGLEIDALILEAQKLPENRKDDKDLLVAYVSGRAINILKNLNAIPLKERNAFIVELQERPSLETLRIIEFFIYNHFNENTRTGKIELNSKEYEQLKNAQKILRESVRDATHAYENSLTKITAEIIGSFREARRMMTTVDEIIPEAPELEWEEEAEADIEYLENRIGITKEDKEEIVYLNSMLHWAQNSSISQEALQEALKRAEIFAKKTEAQETDENLLMGYLAQRAINAIKSIDIKNISKGEEIVRALEENPSLLNLQAAEATIYPYLDRELKASLNTSKETANLQRVHTILANTMIRAREIYTNSLAGIAKKIEKELQSKAGIIKPANTTPLEGAESSDRRAA